MTDRRPAAETRRYGRTASLLSAGVGAAGLLTYAFFSLSSHNLDATQYGEIVVLWSAVFVTISVAHRPVEQLLSRTLAERRARGEEIGSALRVGAAIQLAVGLVLAALTLALREQLEDGLFSGSETLYWVFLFAVTTFGVSFYTRGCLAGSRRFALLALLLVTEAAARAAFALALALGIADGQSAVAVGVAAAPAVSLAVAPIALREVVRRQPPHGEPAAPVTVAAGGSFAAAVLLVMLSEQVFLNSGPLLLRAFEGAAAAGFIFNVLMVARAPVLVFQGVATSLLPHLTRLRARAGGGEAAFHHSVRTTLIAVAAFALFVVAIVAAVGPQLMQAAFGDRFVYDRAGLVIVAVGMGFYLASTTLSQAALAHGAAARAARGWAIAASTFLVWCLLPIVEDEARRIELGFLGAAALLAVLLARVYRTAPDEAIVPDSPEEIEARLAAADEAS